MRYSLDSSFPYLAINFSETVTGLKDVTFTYFCVDCALLVGLHGYLVSTGHW
jgi:hypothetical protein